MSGKKYLVLLGILALLSFGGALGVSLLLGGGGPEASAGKDPNRSLTQGQAVLAGLGAPRPDRKPPSRIAVEEMIKDLRLRLSEVQRRSRSLDERARRLDLAEQAVRQRAKELEKLRMQLVGPLTRLKDAIARMERSRVRVRKEEKANIVRIAATYEKMDAARGAEILTGMCTNEQTDDVVRILYYMNERCSAKLLGEMTDQALAARLTGLMQKVREEG